MEIAPNLIDITPADAAVIAGEIHARMTKKGIINLKKMLSGENDYSKYQQDPVGFGQDVLGEQYTDDIVRVMESVRDNPITIAVSATGTGKSQPIETPVLTPSGYMAIGALEIGDFVIGRNGEPVPVVGVFPQGMQPSYKILFNDGASTTCSGDHLWVAQSRSSKSKSGEKCNQIYTATALKDIIHRGMHIPMCGPVKFEEKNLLINPYVMGVLIGDGTLGQSVRFDSPDRYIVNRVRQSLPDGVEAKFYRRTHYGITTPLGKPNPILEAIGVYGLRGKGSIEKFIPPIFLNGSVDQRKDLLCGLMDTDGYCDKRGVSQYGTSSLQLCKDVQELVWSLGGNARVTSKKPKYTHNGEKRTGKKAYTITIKTLFCPFSLKRKAERWSDPKKTKKVPHRIIKSIEYCGNKESVCIQVGDTNGLYLTENCIVTHNTHGAARVAVWWYKVFPEAKVYTAAAPPVTNLRDLLWGEINNIAFKNPTLFADDDVQSLLIKLKGHKDIQGEPPHLIRGLAIPSSGTKQERESKFSGKHAPQILFIFDEGDAIPDEVYAGADGGMSGGLARMLIMFNPKQKMGAPFRMIRDKVANVVELSAFNHPNVTTGNDVIPGAVTRAKTVERIAVWTRKLVEGESVEDKEIFQVPQFLDGCRFGDRAALSAGEKRVVEEPAFAYKVLGKYPKQSIQQLISEEWVNMARSRWDAHVARFGETPPRGTSCSAGLDAAEFGDDVNAWCSRWGGFVERFVTWGGVDMIETGDRASAEYRKRTPILQCNVDAIGVGAGVAPHMRRLGCAAAYSVKSSEKPTLNAADLGEFGTLRDQLYWSIREWLRADPGAMLPPDEELIEELVVPTYDVVNGKVKVTPKRSVSSASGVKRISMYDILKRSPNKMDALGLTFAPKKAKARRQGALDIIPSNFAWT